jgi:hypothetical protein
MPKAFPKEFCRDVIAVMRQAAWKREATLAHIAIDFEVSLGLFAAVR